MASEGRRRRHTRRCRYWRWCRFPLLSSFLVPSLTAPLSRSPPLGVSSTLQCLASRSPPLAVVSRWQETKCRLVPWRRASMKIPVSRGASCSCLCCPVMRVSCVIQRLATGVLTREKQEATGSSRCASALEVGTLGDMSCCCRNEDWANWHVCLSVSMYMCVSHVSAFVCVCVAQRCARHHSVVVCRFGTSASGRSMEGIQQACPLPCSLQVHASFWPLSRPALALTCTSTQLRRWCRDAALQLQLSASRAACLMVALWLPADVVVDLRSRVASPADVCACEELESRMSS